jgi:hypothetical protein
MQSLLEDRFKLVAHRETPAASRLRAGSREGWKDRAQLKPHPAESPCSTAPPASHSSLLSATVATLLGVWPENCGDVDDIGTSRVSRVGARNVSTEEIADMLLEKRKGLGNGLS